MVKTYNAMNLVDEELKSVNPELVKRPTKLKIKGLKGKETDIVENRVIDRYGFIPISIWNLKRDYNILNIVEGHIQARMKVMRDAMPNKVNGRKNVRKRYTINDNKDEFPVSEFDPELVRRCLMLYTDDCSAKVLDPFCHAGIVPILSAYWGRNGYGNDIVDTYIESAKTQIDHLRESEYNGDWLDKIHLNVGDVRNIVDITKNWNVDYFDYVITSPPFWIVRKYKNVEGQMSLIKEYDEFMKEYTNVIEQLGNILKPGAFITFVINDFKFDKKYINFHGDTINCFNLTGMFELHDIIINIVKTPFVVGIGSAMENKRMIKYHEYLVTFRKI